MYRGLCLGERLYAFVCTLTDSKQNLIWEDFYLPEWWEFYISCWGQKRDFSLTGELLWKGRVVRYLTKVLYCYFKYQRSNPDVVTKRRYKIILTICFWNYLKFIYLKQLEERIHILWFETKVFAETTLCEENGVNNNWYIEYKLIFWKFKAFLIIHIQILSGFVRMVLGSSQSLN